MDDAERERIIQAIVESGSGIFGTEVCQICGQLGSYRGWADATGNHMSGEFVPFAHGHVPPDDTLPSGWAAYGEAAYAHVRELLDARRERFCELCRRSLRRREDRRAGRYWLCDACRAAGGEVKISPRRRYLEHEVQEDEALRRWGETVGTLRSS
jgi:ribosomal protein L37AE/L43A